MFDLETGAQWHVKGEGNANIVFSYAGSDARKV